MVVVLLAVAPEHGLGVGERRKVMLREALSSYAGIEGLDRRVVGRFPRPAEVERDAVRVRPLIERPRGELRAVVALDRRRQPARAGDAGQDLRHVAAAEVAGGIERDAFAGVRIDQREDAET